MMVGDNWLYQFRVDLWSGGLGWLVGEVEGTKVLGEQDCWRWQGSVVWLGRQKGEEGERVDILTPVLLIILDGVGPG